MLHLYLCQPHDFITYTQLHQCHHLDFRHCFVQSACWRISYTITILGSRFSTSWGWKTVMRASVLTALLLSFCPTIRVTSSGLSSKWFMSDWHSPRMVYLTKTYPFQKPQQQQEQQIKIAQIKQSKHATSDEAECCGLALIPHLLRIVFARRW